MSILAAVAEIELQAFKAPSRATFMTRQTLAMAAATSIEPAAVAMEFEALIADAARAA
jgi:hypothetical protein